MWRNSCDCGEWNCDSFLHPVLCIERQGMWNKRVYVKRCGGVMKQRTYSRRANPLTCPRNVFTSLWTSFFDLIKDIQGTVTKHLQSIKEYYILSQYFQNNYFMSFRISSCVFWDLLKNVYVGWRCVGHFEISTTIFHLWPCLRLITIGFFKTGINRHHNIIWNEMQ